MTTRMNALHNCKNPYQGKDKKVLTVCSAGLLRSPTLAWILGQHNYNVRACGIHDYALVPIDSVLVAWADIIIFVHPDIEFACPLAYKYVKDKQIFTFNVPDIYEYKDPELVTILVKECENHKLIEDLTEYT